MLLSAVIRLRPLAPASLPEDQGRALNAEFIRLVDQSDPALARQLHDDNGLKPFTVSDLRGGPSARLGRLELSPDRELWWRVTSADAALTRLLLETILPHLAGETLRAGPVHFAVAGVETQASGSAWAGCESYEDFVARTLLHPAPPASRFTLEFASPTTFRSNGQNVPLPLPDLLLGSWVERWNTFAPVGLERAARFAGREVLEVSRYELATRAVHYGQTTLIGFTGRCGFHIAAQDPYWQRLAHTLANFAFYCGTGAKTSFGLGQTRLLNSEH